MPEIGVEGKEVIIEAISTLVHIKATMVDLLLKPAGVPPEVYRDLLYKRDEVSGYTLSKRKIAPLIVERLEKQAGGKLVLRKLIEVVANWRSFHLAHDEYNARATVQKAREFLDVLETMEAREAKQRELARKQELARMEHERAALLRRESELLLLMFDELARSGDPHRRGFLLQDLLNRVFTLHGIGIVRSFTRNEGAEQIDGAFKLEGWHYLVECRWRKKLADIRELDGLKGQVDRSGRQTMGFFLSMNGWSDNVPRLLKQNPEKSMVLMDGYDLRSVLAMEIDLSNFILAKIAQLNYEGEPFYGARQYIKEYSA